jgi:4-hydroxybenzoate polyprenyltransferase
MGWKKVLFIKNLIIAYAFVTTILLGALISDTTLEPIILYFASMGFIIGLAFEIMIDIANVIGDNANTEITFFSVSFLYQYFPMDSHRFRYSKINQQNELVG